MLGILTLRFDRKNPILFFIKESGIFQMEVFHQNPHFPPLSFGMRLIDRMVAAGLGRLFHHGPFDKPLRLF